MRSSGFRIVIGGSDRNLHTRKSLKVEMGSRSSVIYRLVVDVELEIAAHSLVGGEEGVRFNRM